MNLLGNHATVFFIHFLLRVSWVIFSSSKPFSTGCSTDCYKDGSGVDCRAYYCMGHTRSGMYHVTPYGACTGYDVYCDMATDGGGWLVFQRRVDGSTDFYRDWNDYELGFGNVSHEHWLGLLPLLRIMSQNRHMYELRIDLEDFEGETRYAKYSFFDIGSPVDNYRLLISGYSGNAGDGMKYHNRAMFSTKDRENDKHPTIVCADTFKGGWWYDHCHQVNLNGLYLRGNHSTRADGVNWIMWKGHHYSLKTAEMKVRRI